MFNRSRKLVRKLTGKPDLRLPPPHPVARLMEQQGQFDANWYLAHNPDVAADKRWRQQPAMHYLQFGAKEGRQPVAWFDSQYYLQSNTDVAKSGANPFVHFLQHGRAEGRKPNNFLLINQLSGADDMLALNDKQQVSLTLPLFNKTSQLQLALRLHSDDDKTCGLLLAELVDAKGKVMTLTHCGPLRFSTVFGKWYRYVMSARQQDDVFVIPVPPAAALLRLTLRPWQGKQVRVRNAIVPSWLPNPVRPSLSAAAEVVSQLKTPDQLRVALLADEFTYNSFRDEFNAITFTPDNWQQVFAAQKPELFFCESAWSGTDPRVRPWKGKVYASENFKHENRQVLLEILAYCKQHNIPTLFWNKEDPTHYTDRKHDFVKTAVLFDYVFTSAAECVEHYKTDYGVKHAFALPFATNPRLFNPLTESARSNKVVFAGSWYANHVARSEVMAKVLDGLIAEGFEPEIYDRYYGDPDPLHKWPEQYLPYVKPGQPHDQMPLVYKSSALGLNFNTVTESSTMFARRVFELMSSNTLVVSNYAKGVADMFGELVVFADREPKRLGSLTAETITSLRRKALDNVLANHTYSVRWRYMLNCIGYATAADNTSLLWCAPVDSPSEAEQAISVFEQQFGREPQARLLLLCTEAFAVTELASMYQRFNRFGISVSSVHFARHYALEGRYQPAQASSVLIARPKQIPTLDWLNMARHHLVYLNAHLATPANNDMALQHDTLAADAVLLMQSAQWQNWLDAWLTAQPMAVFRL
ncbi:DUF3880 domain-containing protein [Rheinheimera baltica]|uniref:CgeB family protein n=1 Tax=Rheinheimera baltica TaxID=67576 RepID=UPI00273D0630|nr:glycosyltransferase [Rheinheimera baltica]MDP5143052.1 DUF3880 domain-containing protein [Rheinheimera baltica]